MSKEAPLQVNFDGELIDNRTRKQKWAAKVAEGYQQAEMFGQRELAQFGVRARPQMPAVTRSGKPLVMALVMEDPRTEEEKESDRQREAEALTGSLFPKSAPPEEEQPQTPVGSIVDTRPGASIIDAHGDAMEAPDDTAANPSGL